MVLLAAGSETHIALEAGRILAADGVGVRVVSMPSWELFEMQAESYREEVLPRALTRRIAIEAAVSSIDSPSR